MGDRRQAEGKENSDEVSSDTTDSFIEKYRDIQCGFVARFIPNYDPTLEADYHSDSHDSDILDILKWNSFRLFEHPAVKTAYKRYNKLDDKAQSTLKVKRRIKYSKT